MRQGKAKTTELGLLKSCLATLGMTPADRSRVAASAAPTKDDWADFDAPVN
jgi:hypothetical protein